METKGICPVVFVGGEVKACNDINALFTNPFETKLETDKAREKAIISIYERSKNKNETMLWDATRIAINKKSHYDAGMAFLVTNISDLVMNTLIAFIQDSITPAKMSIEDKETGEASSNAMFVGGFFTDDYFNINVMDEVTNAVIASQIDACFCINSKEFDKIYVTMDMCMSIVYSFLVTKVFDPFIVTHVMNALTRSTGLDRLYDLLYYKCYEEEVKSLPGAQIEYAFCTSVLREIMENNLITFRTGLIMIARTAALMCVNKESSNILRLESDDDSEE